MADITMCINIKCPRRHECYRVLAVPADHQSWCDFDISRDDYFWEMH